MISPICDRITELVTRELARRRSEINADTDLSQVKILVKIDRQKRSVRSVVLERESERDC